MLIASYAEQYREDVVNIINNFYTEALREYTAPINKEILNKTIDAYKDNSFLLIIDGKCEGILSGIATTSPLNGEKCYQELIWFVNKPFRKYGVFLLRKVEQLLKEQGYKQLIMACMANSKYVELSKLYHKMNFILFESHFLKNL